MSLTTISLGSYLRGLLDSADGEHAIMNAVFRKEGVSPTFVSRHGLTNDEWVSACLDKAVASDVMKIHFWDGTWKKITLKRPDNDESSDSDVSVLSDDLPPSSIVPRTSRRASSSESTDLQPVASYAMGSGPPANIANVDSTGLYANQKKNIRQAVKLLEASGVNSDFINQTIISLQDLIGKCSICEDASHELCDLPCRHKICAVCLSQILQSVNKSCPYCRASISHLEALLPTIVATIADQSTPDLSTVELPPDHGKIVVKIIMVGKTDISLLVSPKSSVSSLRRLALVQWGLPVKFATRIRLHLGDNHITSAPLKFLITHGVLHNSTLTATMVDPGAGAPKPVKKTIDKAKDDVNALRLQIKLESYKQAIKNSKDKVSEGAQSLEVLSKVEVAMTNFALDVDRNPVEAVKHLLMKLDLADIATFCGNLESCTSSNFEDKVRRFAHELYGKDMKSIMDLSTSFDAAKSTGVNLLVYAFLKGGITSKVLMGLISHVKTYKEGQSASSSSSVPHADALAESLAKMSM